MMATITLGPSGITADGAHLGWAATIAVLQTHNAPLPGSAPRLGLPPETHATRIADWKAA